MSRIKLTPLDRVSFELSQGVYTPNTFDQGKRRVKAWSKRLELFFGFIPALLVFLITYGKKFR